MGDSDDRTVRIDKLVFNHRKLLRAAKAPAVRSDYVNLHPALSKGVHHLAAVMRVHVILVPATNVRQSNGRVLFRNCGHLIYLPSASMSHVSIDQVAEGSRCALWH
jgi:hypothetical protein